LLVAVLSGAAVCRLQRHLTRTTSRSLAAAVTAQLSKEVAAAALRVALVVRSRPAWGESALPRLRRMTAAALAAAAVARLWV
jgi:hypothetical protein